MVWINFLAFSFNCGEKTAEVDVVLFTLFFYILTWENCERKLWVFLKLWLYFLRKCKYSKLYKAAFVFTNILLNCISASLITASSLGIRIFLSLQMFLLWFSFTACLSYLIGLLIWLVVLATSAYDGFF